MKSSLARESQQLTFLSELKEQNSKEQLFQVNQYNNTKIYLSLLSSHHETIII